MNRALTRECPADGLVVWQPKRGFRYSLDAFCLAGWALEGGTPARALDVGTGSGVCALLLKHAGVAEVEGVDVQPGWIPLARRSAADSGLDVHFTAADVRTLTPTTPFDLVLSNPPFREPSTGPVSPDPMRAAARHTLHGSLPALLHAMCALGPRVCVVLPQDREKTALASLAKWDRTLRRRCTLGSRLVLLDARIASGPVEEETVDLGDDLSQSPRVQAWYQRLGVALRPNPSPAPQAAGPSSSRTPAPPKRDASGPSQ